jgi:apolipoprotein N-acyltransferase
VSRLPAPGRAALAVAGGLALYAAHPPLGQGWLGLVVLAPLLALARDLSADAGGGRLRSALGYGTLAGLAAFLPLLHWIRYIGEVVAWPLLALSQALFLGVFLVLVVAWGPRRWRPLAAVAAWVAIEALRSAWPLGGFPWGVLGYTQADGGMLLGIARTLGVLGVSAACAAVGACLEEAVHRVRGALAGATWRHWGERGFAAARTPVLSLLAVLVGGVLLTGAPPQGDGRTVDVLGVQGWNADAGDGRSLLRSVAVAESMQQVTRRALGSGPAPDLVVWPENGLDGDPRSSDRLAGVLQGTLDDLGGVPLLTGVIEDGPAAGTELNAMALYEGEAEPRARYVKRRPVPFGEYIPLRRWLDWFPAFARVPTDRLPGTEATVVDAAGARIGPSICFDVVFPAYAREQVRGGAEVLVVGTNNSSYGPTAMSDQHIAFSQLRAVETGRWVVHVAVSGRSALVDPEGRVHQRTGQFAQATVRGDVPLATGLTPAMRVGGGVGWAAIALVVAGLGNLLLGRLQTARRGHRRTMDDPESPTARDEVAEELDRRDPLDDVPADDARDVDQAWEESEAMSGEQPSG